MGKAVVIFSGGQDSTTCLCWAVNQFGIQNVETISFDYGQRHKIELESAKKISKELGVSHKIYKMDVFSEIGNNALINEVPILMGVNGLPNTFVPGRNLVFITYAAMHAYSVKAHDLVIGVSQADYSGYPDCRQGTIDSLAHALNLGMEYTLRIHTPLINLTKKQTVELMKNLGFLPLLKYSHTCYTGQRPPCNECPACKLRSKGFLEAGIEDPLYSSFTRSEHSSKHNDSKEFI